MGVDLLDMAVAFDEEQVVDFFDLVPLPTRRKMIFLMSKSFLSSTASTKFMALL